MEDDTATKGNTEPKNKIILPETKEKSKFFSAISWFSFRVGNLNDPIRWTVSLFTAIFPFAHIIEFAINIPAFIFSTYVTYLNYNALSTVDKHAKKVSILEGVLDFTSGALFNIEILGSLFWPILFTLAGPILVIVGFGIESVRAAVRAINGIQKLSSTSGENRQNLLKRIAFDIAMCICLIASIVSIGVLLFSPFAPLLMAITFTGFLFIRSCMKLVEPTIVPKSDINKNQQPHIPIEKDIVIYKPALNLNIQAIQDGISNTSRPTLKK